MLNYIYIITIKSNGKQRLLKIHWLYSYSKNRISTTRMLQYCTCVEQNLSTTKKNFGIGSKCNKTDLDNDVTRKFNV